jgi:hypothetical protein
VGVAVYGGSVTALIERQEQIGDNRSRPTYLAISVYPEDEPDLVSFNNLLLNLRGDPTLGLIWQPGPSADLIARHGV